MNWRGSRWPNARHSFQLKKRARREDDRAQSKIASDCKHLNRRRPLNTQRGLAVSRKKDEANVITETFDPAFWSIATVLTAATFYLACLF